MIFNYSVYNVEVNELICIMENIKIYCLSSSLIVSIYYIHIYSSHTRTYLACVSGKCTGKHLLNMPLEEIDRTTK